VNLSEQEYKAIIVPAISVISETTTNKLMEFINAGGKVQFWDATSGDMKRLKSKSDGIDKTTIQLDFKGWETKFIFISK
jgi:hypothetical protein